MKRAIILLSSLLILVSLGYFAINSFKPKTKLQGTALQNPIDIANVKLTNINLGEISLAKFKGKTLLVFFGFSKCYDVCPITLQRLAKIYKDISEPANLQIIMITVDPANDTVKSVQEYVNKFHPSFLGFSGTNSEIAQAAKTFFVGYQDLGDTQFSHTDAIYVIDPNSKIRRIYGQPDLRYLENDLLSILKNNSY